MAAYVHVNSSSRLRTTRSCIHSAAPFRGRLQASQTTGACLTRRATPFAQPGFPFAREARGVRQPRTQSAELIVDGDTDLIGPGAQPPHWVLPNVLCFLPSESMQCGSSPSNVGLDRRSRRVWKQANRLAQPARVRERPPRAPTVVVVPWQQESTRMARGQALEAKSKTPERIEDPSALRYICKRGQSSRLLRAGLLSVS